MVNTRSTHQRESTKVWIIAVAVFVLLVALAGYIQWRMAKSPTPLQEEVPEVVAPNIQSIEEVAEYTAGRPLPPVAEVETAGKIGPDPEMLGEHIRGNVDARISIVEYASLTNQYARIIHPELAKLIERNPDVNWIFRHYPLQDIALDYPAGIMSECVYNQMGDTVFWQFIGDVFAGQDWTEQSMQLLAEESVTDVEAFRACLVSPAAKKVVVDHKRIGFYEGKVTVIPSFIFVDKLTGQERVITGVDTPEYFQWVVDAMMAVEG